MSVSKQPAPETRRPGRPRSLTLDQIVQAALALSNASSLDALSMRALANALGVPVMTIYNYVSSKEALNELVVDYVLREVDVPEEQVGAWDERIRHLERDARRAMRAHPGLSFSRHGSSSREATRLAEGAMSILQSGGFTQDDAVKGFAALFTFMLGQVELDVLSDTTEGRGEATFEGVTGAARLSRDELFEAGLDAVIAGIKATATKSTSSTRKA